MRSPRSFRQHPTRRLAGPAAMLCALLAGQLPALTGLASRAQAWAETGASPTPPSFEVGLVGDTGYSAEQKNDFLDVRDHMAGHPLSSVVHNGDIWEAGTACTEENFEEQRALFDGFAHPFIYTPGDNEWLDCPEGASRRHLSTIRRIFFGTDESLGRSRLLVARQGPNFVENARWSHQGIVFTTLSVPGPDGGGGDFRKRNPANLAWLHQAFDIAQANGAPGVMVIWQDNPFEPNRRSDLLDALEQRARAFGRPVALVHGDTHHFQIDHPFEGLPTFTRVETFAGGDSDRWVRALIDPTSTDVFTFEKMRA
ncbi:MAG: hypothetical protein ACRDV9_10795 [Acidimicrobiia bacterium]